MIKKILNVGGMTLGSRVLGLVRDILMAATLGAGLAADAFFIAFKLPNFFRRLFAEGAFSAGFIPLFSRRLGQNKDGHGQHRALKFASNVLSIFLPTLFVVLILFEIFMPAVMGVLTGGFSGSSAEKFELVVTLGRLTFPYLMLISLVTLFAGVLNGLGRFSMAASAPMLLNICMITALFFWDDSPLQTAEALAASISIAGIVQLLWVAYGLRRAGASIRLPWPKLTPGVKEMLKIAAPAAIGAGVMQINLLIDLLIAARLLPEGSISYLFYADRLNQLPIGIVGVAVGTVLLPSISRALGAGNRAKAMHEQNRAMEFALYLALPATLGLILAAEPLIAALFERGTFVLADSLAASAALIAYATGLPAYIMVKVLTPVFFARKNTKTPVIFAIISMVINLTFNLLLYKPYGHVGLAIATSIAAWANVIMLYIYLKIQKSFVADKPLFIRLAKSFMGTLFMGAAIWFLLPWVTELIHAGGEDKALGLGVLVSVSFLIYFGSTVLLKTFNKKDMSSLISRGS